MDIIKEAKIRFAECCDAKSVGFELIKVKDNIQQAIDVNGITSQEKDYLLRHVNAAALNAIGRLRGTI